MRWKCGGRDFGLSDHAGGDRQDPVSAGEIAAQTDRLARKTYGLRVVFPDKLGVGGDAVINRGKRVARAQPQRTLRGFTGFLPASAITECRVKIFSDIELLLDRGDDRFGDFVLHSEHVGEVSVVVFRSDMVPVATSLSEVTVGSVRRGAATGHDRGITAGRWPARQSFGCLH